MPADQINPASASDSSRRCHECGLHYDPDDMTCHDGHDLCQECLDNLGTPCCHCSERVNPDSMTQYGNGHLCESCYDSHYFTCDHCESIARERDSYSVGDESWCRQCYRDDAFRCCSCDDAFPDDESVSYGGDSLCQSCYEDGYFTCDNCSEVHPNDDYSGDGLCSECHEDNDSIMSYDTDVCHVLNVSVPRRAIYYGIELEVEQTSGPYGKEDSARQCRERLGEGYCITKHDGSLGSGGFEIVTIPKSLSDHIDIWTSFLDRIPSGLRSWNTSGRCGMHVHVSRKPLSLLTIGKLLVFINADENADFITSLAGRESSGCCERSPKKVSDARRYRSRGAINLQNTHTIEFRIFRGTLNKGAFMKNLEFVAACVKFCKFTGIHRLDVLAFLGWFVGFRKEYPSLDKWLTDRNYIKPRSKTRKAGI